MKNDKNHSPYSSSIKIIKKLWDGPEI